jgi:hypothetical protein
MKTHILHPLLLAAAVLLPLWASAQAPAPTAVPSTISYQGRVLDTSGTPVGAGTPVNRTVIFRIWDSASSTAAANLLYSESQTVTISDGEFSVLVGNGLANTTQTFQYSETVKGPPTVTLASVFNGTERFLGVTVAGAATITTSDNEISPRQQVVGTAYAFRARVAESLSAGGTTALTVANGGNVGIGTTTPSAPLSLGISLSNTKLALFDSGAATYGLGVMDSQFRLHLGASSARYSFLDGAAGTELMTLTGTGNLGLGIRDPVADLRLAYSTGWKGMHIDTGALPGVSIVQGSSNARLHLRNTTALDLTRDLCLTNESSSATLRWMGAGNVSRVAIFTANQNGDMTFASNGTFGGGLTATTGTFSGALTGTSGTFSGQINVNNGNLAAEPTGGQLGGNGMRLILYPGSNITTPYGFGIANGVLYSVTPSDALHKWYGGTTERMSLNGLNGNLTVAGIITGASINTPGNITGASINTPGNITGGSISTTGRVIIGPSANTTNIPLYVSATTTTSLATYAFLGADGDSRDDGTHSNFSIKADGNIGGALIFVTSDARMKKIVGLSDSAADLKRLMDVRITDYTFIDPTRFPMAEQKKVIAQELEQIYPEAVIKSCDVVPDVFQKAMVKEGWVSLTTNLKAGERVKLISKSVIGVYEVLAAEKGRFRTAAAMQEGEPVFVYGREVQDFRSVDYEALTTLNVSATQQLKKEKDALAAENEKMRAQLENQEKRLKALEAADKARDAKLAALERLLDGEAKPAARTVLLKKDTGAE